MDDEALIRAVAAGDHTAVRELFDRHAPWVAGRLRRVLPVDAVEDVLQETFIAVWRGAGRYQSTGEVGAWIWGIARRQTAMWLRKHGRTAPMLTAESAEDAANIAIQRVDLQQALARLGPEGNAERDLVQLVFIEDRAVAEVASILDIPEGTVKSRVHRLRRRLRAYLRGGER
ncbi:MAG TPA: RNA polymerase sigma factor [Nitrolancea sp.]|nr:RNA polymerase sigma factor [Nitrolancea sp.]